MDLKETKKKKKPEQQRGDLLTADTLQKKGCTFLWHALFYLPTARLIAVIEKKKKKKRRKEKSHTNFKEKNGNNAPNEVMA